MNKLNLGIDLGITSVGWGITNDEKKIIASGVRLFEEASGDNNTKRRTFRSLRRQLRRRKARILRMFKYLEEIGIINENFKYLENPYVLRIKGTKEALTNNELATALLHIAKRRGSSLEVAEDEKTSNVESLKAILKKNQKDAETNFVSELQINKFTETGVIRGFDNVYKTSDYVKELEAILLHQELSHAQKQRIVDIIKTRRLFSDGPGSELSPSNYGRFRPIDDKLKKEILNTFKEPFRQKYLKETFSYEYNNENYRVFKSGIIVNKNPLNLIDIMKGKCSLYPNEFRAPKMSYSAELHNFLNDLNNLSYGLKQEKLSKSQKEAIIKVVLQNGKFSYSDLKKYLTIKDDELITGTRLLGNKPVLTEFKGFSKIFKVFKQFNTDLTDTLIVDYVADVLTSYQAIEDRNKLLNERISDQSLVLMLSQLTGFSGAHAFSYKALNFLNKEMMETTLNQQQIIEESKIRKQNTLDKFILDLEVTNPVVRRVQQQAFKVYKDLVSEFGIFDRVIIETTRSKNSIEERKKIKNRQDNNRIKRLETDQFLEDSGIEVERYMNHQTSLKIRLYNEQHGKCAYSGISLDLEKLISDPQFYQIDHIIPYSISMDDSLSNKVLITSHANQLKGNRTPFGYFHSGRVDSMFPIQTYDQFKLFVINNASYSFKKKQMLLFESDINKYEVQADFKNRNLTDTSFTIRSFMNILKKYNAFKDYKTGVFTIRGEQTSLFRSLAVSLWFKKYPNATIKNPLIKNRDFYKHHAIDALIISVLSSQSVFRKMYDLDVTDNHKHVYNDKTGELMENNPLEDKTLYTFFTDLSKVLDEDVRFSWKIDSKVNRSISDQTIYSTRTVDNETRVVKKYKNIYELKSEQLNKILSEKEREKLLVYKNDTQTFEIISNAYNQYKHEKNPLKVFSENHGEIRKYAKNGKGPKVTSLKYLEDRLGNHISITHKFKNTRRQVVLLQLSTYRIDIYKHNNIYKFVTVRYQDVKWDDSFKKNSINEVWYQLEKEKKNITKEYVFQFSLYRNSIIKIFKLSNHDEIHRVISTNNDLKNIIEVKATNQRNEKQLMLTIGKSIVKIEKYNVSSTGKYKKIDSEGLKLVF